jgi:hypothetical protein
MISASLRRQIRRLVVPQEMAGSNNPQRVMVQPSSIPGGGYGVFYNDVGRCKPLRDDHSNDDIANGKINAPECDLQVLCLYPGVYTPPLPLHVLMASQCDAQPVEDVYLAREISPSGVDFQNNPYVLNLSTRMGGYIDAMALDRYSLQRGDGEQNDDTLSIGMCDVDDARLDFSPSACGHLINHYRFGGGKKYEHANVQVVPFWWKDVLQSEEDVNVLSEWRLPNVLRCDKSPWYLDISTDQVVYFPDEQQQDSLHHLVAGAAITTLPKCDGEDIILEHGQELFLDYELQAPYPTWAAGWYRQ